MNPQWTVNLPIVTGGSTLPEKKLVVDVSEWQGVIDWRKMDSHGVTDAYIRLTRGIDYVDTLGLVNVANAGVFDIRWGAYHYHIHHQDSYEQARWFLSQLPDGFSLPPALDVEGSL